MAGTLFPEKGGFPMCSCSGGVKLTRDNLDYYEKLWKNLWQRLRPAAETAEEKRED